MCFDGAAIVVDNVGKSFQIFNKPSDRIKQFFWSLVWRIFGGVRKIYFNQFYALSDVSLNVQRGETVGIIGRNGSGKSTLLQIICGTLHPNQGAVRVNGRVAALLELGSGFNPDFTGRENVYFNAAILGLNRDEINKKFADIENFADIGLFMDQPVKTYSSGMLVRLAFSVIAHVEADILVIDEALAVGDAFFTQKCMRFLRDFMKNGTVLFVSHDVSSIKSLCTRVIWLNAGQVVAEGSPKEICDLYLKEYYAAQHDVTGHGKITRDTEALTVRSYKDQRTECINRSNLRNDIEVFQFNREARAFGQGGAAIVDVVLLDENDSPMSWIVGGEMVCIQVTVECRTYLGSPIVGFMVKDRLGQELFGDNSSLNYGPGSLNCFEGGLLNARFLFQMPRLPVGSYSVAVAVADGTQLEHVQHHWIYDALIFSSTSTSVASGLIGLPIHSIELVVS